MLGLHRCIRSRSQHILPRLYVWCYSIGFKILASRLSLSALGSWFVMQKCLLRFSCLFVHVPERTR